MIRINLLPTKRRAKPKPIPRFVIVGVFLFLLSGIVAFYVSYYMSSKIESLGKQKKANADRIAALNEKIKEVKGFEQLNKTFTERKEIIEELTRHQSLPAKILDEMSMRLHESVWIHNLSIVQGKINISGSGFNPADVVAYVQNLKDSPMFENVTLLETNAAGDTYTFKIIMDVVSNKQA